MPPTGAALYQKEPRTSNLTNYCPRFPPDGLLFGPVLRSSGFGLGPAGRDGAPGACIVRFCDHAIQSTMIGLAMKIEEYVPVSTPMNMQ